MMNEAELLGAAIGTIVRFLGIGVLAIAILAWFIGWIKDKIA